MSELYLVGIDLAKRVFQVHGADANGRTLFRKKLSRAQFSRFISETPSCIMALEACATAHYWGRVAEAAGHAVRLVPPVHVKPFVKRHKSDVIDAEAIAEAALRPNMLFVAVKSEAQQAQAVAFRTRELLVRQRTQQINAFRAHLAEFGVALPQGARSVRTLARDFETIAVEIPTAVFTVTKLLLSQIEAINAEIGKLDKELRDAASKSENTRRIQTMPGVGPMTALAIQAFCPPAEVFEKGRHFAAWLGLVPRQHSTGGRERLGRITKMGQRDVRRLLIIGAMSVISASERKKHCDDPWLTRMLEKRPKMVVAIALANRMARRLWAMLKSGRDYEIRGTTA